ncbi:hypothetical protein QYM36_015254, partial [Artemia franciscana]
MGKPDANPERVIERHTVGHRCPNDERMLQLAKYINLYKLKRREQAGFRPGRGCQEHILTLRLILQKNKRFHLSASIAFLDFVAAFDSLIRIEIWKIMVKSGVPAELIENPREAVKDNESRQSNTGGVVTTCIAIMIHDTYNAQAMKLDKSVKYRPFCRT